MGKRHFQNIILRLKWLLSLSSLILNSLNGNVNVSNLQNYTYFEGHITRAESQKNTDTFFRYHLNLFICCKTKLKIKFMFYSKRLY